jgi:hypothetical protein
MQYRMVPEAPRIASSHSGHMRHTGHLGGEKSRDPIGLRVMGIDDIEWPSECARAALAASFETNGLAIGMGTGQRAPFRLWVRFRRQTCRRHRCAFTAEDSTIPENPPA